MPELIMFYIWLCTVPFVFWAMGSAKFNITWKQYPEYIKNHKRQAWPVVSIVCWVLIWVEVGVTL